MFLQNTKSEAQLRREELDRKLANVTARFEHIQFADGNEGSWVPNQSGEDTQPAGNEIRKAVVNRTSTTREPVHVTGRGERATWVEGTSLDCKSRLLNLSAKLVEEAKRNFKSTHNALVAATHQNPEQKVHFTGSIMNADAKFDLEKAKRLHTENMVKWLENNTTNKVVELQARLNAFIS